MRMVPVFQRSRLCMLLEGAEKISQIIISTFQADLHHRQVCLLEQPHCLFDTVFIEIFHGGTPNRFLKKTSEILLVHMHLFCKVLNINLLFVVFPDISKDGLNPFHTLVQILLRRRKEPVA